MKKTIFLDRDGVLCEDTGYVTDFSKLRLFPFAKKAVEKFHKKGFLVVVITNQSAVARGFMTEDTLREIHKFMKRELAFDYVYYCPHISKGEIKSSPCCERYVMDCDCRKPKSGLIALANREIGIDISNSFMAGDSERDILCAKEAKLTSVFIGDLENPYDADLVFENVLAFSEWL